MSKTNRILKISMMFFLTLIISIMVNLISAEASENDWKVDISNEMVMPNKKWKINFSTDIEKSTITKDNIYILKTNKEKFKDIQLNIINDKTIEITPLSEYKQGETYFLCIDRGVKSKEGKSINNPHMLQFSVKTIDSDYFKIRNVVPISKNVLNIFFTQPIDSSAEEPLCYEIYKNQELYIKGEYKNGYPTMIIKKIPECNNGVSIYFTNSNLNADESYVIKVVGNLKSEYGCMLSDGYGDEKIFNGNSLKSEEMNIESIKAINKNIVEIKFNKFLDNFTGQAISNYQIKDVNGVPKVISKVDMLADEKTVKLTLADLLNISQQYEVTVNNVKDYYQLSTIKNYKGNLYFVNFEDNDIHILAVGVQDKETMYVYFDKKVNQEDAVQLSYYQIRGVSDTNYFVYPTKVVYEPEKDPRRVKLYLNRELKDNKVYRLTVLKNLKSEIGNTSITDSVYEFVGSSVEHATPYIKEAVIIGKNYIRLTFSEEIQNQSVNTQLSNYVLQWNESENKKVIYSCSEVKYINSNTLILKFDELNTEQEYVLKMTSLIDYMGKAYDMSILKFDVFPGK